MLPPRKRAIVTRRLWIQLDEYRGSEHLLATEEVQYRTRMLTDGAAYQLDLKDGSDEQAKIVSLFFDELLMYTRRERQRLVAIGSFPAEERLIHFLLDIQKRLGSGGNSSARFPLPLTQGEIGSCLGLTSVYVNRVIRKLGRCGLIEFEGRHVRIADHRVLSASVGDQTAHRNSTIRRNRNNGDQLTDSFFEN